MRNTGIETATAVRGAVEEDDLLPIYDEAEVRRFGRAVQQRRARRHDIGAIRAKLTASAAGHVRQAAAQVRGRENTHIPDSDYETFRRSVDRAIIELDQIDRLGDFEHVAVKSELGPYETGSPQLMGA